MIVVLLAAGMICDRTHAQGLAAKYSISMLGVPIGQGAWTVSLGTDVYSISASGGAAGVLAVLMDGAGTAESSGKIRDGHLVPGSFASRSVELGEKFDLKMKLDNGVATALEIGGPPPGPDRLPIRDKDRRKIVDPLTALLIRNDAADGALGPDACNRTLSVFDGRRRYDLLMSFKRRDLLADKVLEGPALTCNIILRPISGHRANSAIIKYVADRQDMEVTFAPIAETPFLAPFRLSVPTLVGTMIVQATQFVLARSH